MKKIFLFLSALVLTAGMMTSCKESKKEVPADEKPAFVFTKQDTTTVMELVEQFTTRLQNRDIKGAVEMITFLNGDSIEELNPMFQQRQAMTLAHIAGLPKYELDRIVFRSDINNEVKIDLTLFEKPEGDPRPNTTSFYFRPVRKGGKWYLTTKDNITDTHSELRNQKPATPTMPESENN